MTPKYRIKRAHKCYFVQIRDGWFWCNLDHSKHASIDAAYKALQRLKDLEESKKVSNFRITYVRGLLVVQRYERELWFPRYRTVKSGFSNSSDAIGYISQCDKNFVIDSIDIEV